MSEAISEKQVEDALIDALAEMGPEREEITRDKTFQELEIDSLDLVELAQIIEDEYGVEITDSDMDALKTVGDVVDLVAQRSV